MARTYFCPVDNTEVTSDQAEGDACPTCGYGPARNFHERDWLDASAQVVSPADDSKAEDAATVTASVKAKPAPPPVEDGPA